MKVSVAICTWNGGRYLEEQLRSLLLQERLPWEVILRDDGSLDKTLEIAARVLANAPFRVDIAKNQENLGSSRNFESALAACTGDVLFPCDQDDLWRADKIRRCVEVMEFARADLVFHDARLFDDAGRSLGRLWEKLSIREDMVRRFAASDCQLAFLLRQPWVTGCCMAIRREAFQKTLPFGEGWIHDEWMAMAVAGHGARLHPLDATLVDYRQHAVQQVGVRNTRLLAQIREVLSADRQAYRKEAIKMTQMAEFLSRSESPSESVALVHEKVLHNRHRAEMGDLSLLDGWRSIREEIYTGRYRAYSWWRGAPLKDFLRTLFPKVSRNRIPR